MSSGVTFSEDYADSSSDIYTLARLTLEQDPEGSLGALKRFKIRRAAPGALSSPTLRPKRRFSVLCSRLLRSEQFPTMPPKSSGNRSVPRPMRRGISTRPGKRLLLPMSTRCSATGRASV